MGEGARHLLGPTVGSMTTDDRRQFGEDQRRYASAVGADSELQADALSVLERSDRHGWSYTWSWLGIPVIQVPEDIVTMQQIVWETRPEVVIETGVARGGSLLLYASILDMVGEGKVIGIDIDIRAHNRDSVERHPLAHRVSLIEGSSIDSTVVAQVREETAGCKRVMVVLDSDHTHDHVLAELRAYGPMVTVGQFLVVADTVVEQLPLQTHRPRPWGPGDNPATALGEYLREVDWFERDAFHNERLLLTSSPGGYLRRVR